VRFHRYAGSGIAETRTQAVSHLQIIADAGEIEAGYGFDRQIGHRLAYEEADAATPDNVDFRPEDFAGCDDYVILHCHRDATPPGAGDWDTLLSNSHLNEIVVVTAAHIFIAEKTEEWKTLVPKLPGYFMLRFQAKLEMLRRAAGYQMTSFVDLPESVRNEFLWQTNQWIALERSIQLTREERT
jgi:hypothetical protein